MATLNEKFAGLIYKLAEKKHLIKKSPELLPIYDGLLGNEKEWKKQDIRIMWVLKEAYSDFTPNGNPKGGGWSFCDEIVKADVSKENYFPLGRKRDSKNTWLNILYVSYGILKGKKELKDVEFCEADNKQDDLDILKKTAVINLSKMPGTTATNKSELRQKFTFWKDLVMEQINSYNPNIIIFGGTFEFFKMEDFGLNSGIKSKYCDFKTNKYKTIVYKTDKAVLINTYHPLRISHNGVNSILKGIKNV